MQMTAFKFASQQSPQKNPHSCLHKGADLRLFQVASKHLETAAMLLSRFAHSIYIWNTYVLVK